MEAAKITIDQEVIDGIIKAEVATAVVKALDGTEQFTKALVEKALNIKVNPKNGEPSTYQGSIPYVEFCSMRAIRTAVDEAIVEAFQEKQKEIYEATKKLVARHPNKLAKALVDGLQKSVSASWRPAINITLKSQED